MPYITIVPSESPDAVCARDHVRRQDPIRLRSYGAGPSEDGGSRFATSHGLDEPLEDGDHFFGEHARFSIVYTARGSGLEGDGYRDAGMTTHRGVLFPGEYVDETKLDAEIKQRVGVSAALMRELYGGRAGGPLRHELHELRAVTDARLREVTSIRALAQQVGINPRALQRAASRSRRAN